MEPDAAALASCDTVAGCLAWAGLSGARSDADSPQGKFYRAFGCEESSQALDLAALPDTDVADYIRQLDVGALDKGKAHRAIRAMRAFAASAAAPAASTTALAVPGSPKGKRVKISAIADPFVDSETPVLSAARAAQLCDD